MPLSMLWLQNTTAKAPLTPMAFVKAECLDASSRMLASRPSNGCRHPGHRSGSGHVLVHVLVVSVTLHVLAADQVFDALLDQPEVRLEHPLQLLHDFHDELHTTHTLSCDCRRQATGVSISSTNFQSPNEPATLVCQHDTTMAQCSQTMLLSAKQELLRRCGSHSDDRGPCGTSWCARWPHQLNAACPCPRLPPPSSAHPGAAEAPVQEHCFDLKLPAHLSR